MLGSLLLLCLCQRMLPLPRLLSPLPQASPLPPIRPLFRLRVRGLLFRLIPRHLPLPQLIPPRPMPLLPRLHLLRVLLWRRLWPDVIRLHQIWPLRPLHRQRPRVLRPLDHLPQTTRTALPQTRRHTRARPQRPKLGAALTRAKTTRAVARALITAR